MSAPAAEEVIVEPIETAATGFGRLFGGFGGGSAWSPSGRQGSGLSHLYGRVRDLFGSLERSGDRRRHATPGGQEANKNIRAARTRLKNRRQRMQDRISDSRGGRHSFFYR